MCKIGLFGGSFDPPTLAHLKIAETLIEREIVDVVEFVPAFVSYHDKEYVASPHQRFDMIWEMIFESDYKEHLTVCTYEIRNEMKSSTYDFCKQYLPKFPDNEYYFIVGMDNAIMIPDFINGDVLMTLLPFIVFDRDNIKCKTDCICQGPCPDTCECLNYWFNKEPHIYLQDIDIPDASSTHIRNELSMMYQMGLSCGFFRMCHGAVFKYIINNNLYIGDSNEG